MALQTLQPWIGTRQRLLRRAFTFIEVMIVVVIIGILAAMVVPRFANAQSDAKLSALKSSLADIRGAIANSYAQSIMSGSPAYPDETQLESLLSGGMPQNPYNGLRGISTLTSQDDAEKRVVDKTSAGWRYFYDNSVSPPVAIFFANLDTKVYDATTNEQVQLNEY